MKTFVFTVVVTLGIVAAPLVAAQSEHDHEHEQHQAAEQPNEAAGEREIAYWVAPMDSSYRRDGPGKSPMGMDLVPVYKDELEAPGQVRVTRAAIRQAMNLRTAPVERGRLWRRIDTVGHVSLNEATVHHIHPRVEGWIRETGVKSEGESVRAGQRLFTLYAPELVNAQEDFLRALRRDDSAAIRSTRQRLMALGVQARFVRELERNRNVVEAVPWHAEMDGVVSMLGIRHGMYVTPASEILELAHLDSVWVNADVFARQHDWLAAGQSVQIRSRQLPGTVIDAEIDYIYPLLDPLTRTTRARIPVSNDDMKLKPGMWVDVRIFAGPMDDVLNIPREALIRTGKAERVIVRLDDELFEVRDVTSGMLSGNYVEIRHGLEEGEQVVTSGQFLLDSEASMQGGDGGGGHDHHH